MGPGSVPDFRASVEPGLYTQVRFVLGGAVLLDDDGGVYGYGDVEAPAGLEITGDLTCPSCSQSGIKVRLPGGVVLAEGDDAGVLMDFDIAQSFGHQAGQSGRWVMHPVILGTVYDAGAIMGGEAEAKITGTVSLGADVVIPMCGGGERELEDFVPVATSTVLVDDDGNALVFMGETDEDGFKIEVLGVDTYDLGYEAETDFGAQKLVWEAEVEPDQAVVEANGDEVDGVAYTVTAVSCEPPSVQSELSLFLKDGPGDVDMVWVQVNDVVLVGQGAPLSLLDEPTDLINLTELEDVAVALVEGVPVEPGLYTQLRFVLGGAVLLDDDGGVYGYGDVEAPAGLEITGDLTCPSCSQSGIKVRLPGGVVLAEGDDAGVLMDFDIAQSFGHQAGQSGRWGHASGHSGHGLRCWSDHGG